MKDYYQILGVQKSATDEDIKKAYRKLAMKHHPDRGGDPKQFQEIQEAYNVLGDEGKRSDYDNPQPQGFYNQAGPFANSGNPQGFDDLFKFFGHEFGPFFRQQHQPKNRNIHLQANITLEDAFTGKELYVTVQLPSGKEQLINVKVPPGVHDGVNLRLAGMGDDSFQMSPRGDVIVQVHVQPHVKFQRQGDDLIQEVSISCIDAILGKEIVIDTVDGKQFTGAIPPGTQPDAMLGIQGQGMPNMNNPASRGRMLLRVKMFVPTLSDQQKEVLRSI